MLWLVVSLALLGCAVSEPQTRIVGGSNAAAGEFPHQASLQILSGGSWFHICGCVYLGGNKILTAAHCTDGRAATAHRVGLGSHQLSTISTHISVTSKTEHPNYNGNAAGYPNDIATMRLASTPPSSGTIQPIALATASGSNFAGVRCTLTGWGRLSGGGSSPNILQKVDMVVLTNTDCSSRWSGISGATVNSGHICIFESGKSACSGDSGGPMVCSGVLAGITSWGISSCSGSYPSVYTRVSSFRSWIDSN